MCQTKIDGLLNILALFVFYHIYHIYHIYKLLLPDINNEWDTSWHGLAHLSIFSLCSQKYELHFMIAMEIDIVYKQV